MTRRALHLVVCISVFLLPSVLLDVGPPTRGMEPPAVIDQPSATQPTPNQPSAPSHQPFATANLLPQKDQPGTIAAPAKPSPDQTVTVRPLPAGAAFMKHSTFPDSSKDHSPLTASLQQSAIGKLVYSNTHGRYVLGPAAGERIADDIITTSAYGCQLDRFVFRVSGDTNNDPNIDEGPFTVNYALYETCPGAAQCQPWEPDCPAPINGTSGAITLPDEGLHEITVVLPPAVCEGGINNGQACSSVVDCLPTCQGGDRDGSFCLSSSDCPGGGFCDADHVGTCVNQVPLPSTHYFAVTFSRQQAGILGGAPPLIGFSADRYDTVSFPCASYFGGFPSARHASFDLELFVADDCPEAFAAYHNSSQNMSPYSPGGGRLFADDLFLAVDAGDCNLVAYDVRLTGEQPLGSAAVQVELHSYLMHSDPQLGLIPGTRMTGQVFGTDIQVLRRTMNPPIQLGQHLGSTNRLLWVVFKVSSTSAGPIATCYDGSLGFGWDSYFEYDSDGGGGWVCQWLGSGCYAAFDVTLYCEGQPPLGACCDVLLLEDYLCVGGDLDGYPCNDENDCGGAPCIGDAVCREVPEWNCPTTDPARWVEGKHCGPVCSGGINHDEACVTDADCLGVCVLGSDDGTSCTSHADCEFHCDLGECNLSSGFSPNKVGGGGLDDCVCPSSSQPVQIWGQDAAGSPIAYSRPRMLSVTAGDPGQLQAIRVTWQAPMPPGWEAWEGQSLFAGEPFCGSEAGGDSFYDPLPCWPGTLQLSVLQCDPYYTDWSVVGEVNLIHEALAPSKLLSAAGPVDIVAYYTVDIISSDCALADPSSYSQRLFVRTASWGDIAAPGPGGSLAVSEDVVNVIDTLQIQAKFTGQPGALSKASSDLLGVTTGPVPMLDGKITVNDLVSVLGAFSGAVYPFDALDAAALPGLCPPAASVGRAPSPAASDMTQPAEDRESASDTVEVRPD